MKVTLYFDEGAQDSDLIRALDLRGINVIGAWAAGMRERKDEEHLFWAAGQKRTLYTFNVRDYCRLHAEFLLQDRSHAGIVVAKQQHYSVGEQMRRLLKLIATKPAEEMKTRSSFSTIGNDWGNARLGLCIIAWPATEVLDVSADRKQNFGPEEALYIGAGEKAAPRDNVTDNDYHN